MMNNVRLVSVVIPCYNVENYIEECVESVFRQTFTNIEVICIDNNSTDKTKTVLHELKSRYPNLIVTFETKKGACAARNKGLSLAKGQWIQFLDADDLILPDKIEHQTNLLRGTTIQVSFIAGSYFRRYASGQEKEVLSQNKQHIFLGVATNSLGITSSNLFYGEKLLEAGGWDEQMSSSQESDLMFRLLKIAPNIVVDTKPLTIVRERTSGSISQTNLDVNLVRYIQLRLQILDYLNQIKTDSSVKQILLQVIFDKIRELYKYDPSKSLELYKKVIPPDFKPKASGTTTSSYLLVYGLLGFKSAEKLKILLNK